MEKTGSTIKTKLLALIAVVAVIAAVVLGVLYAQARVPSWAAAKVGDTYIAESDVAAYIQQARSATSTTDDAAFSSYLQSNNLNVASYRNNCINQLAMNQLINKRADELGVTVEDSEVDEQINSYKESMAFDDDSIWQDTLSQQGLTEDDLRDQISINIKKQRLYDKEVTKEDAGDDETLSYIQQSMAGKELKHAYRIVFTGDDGWDRAQQAYKQLKATGKVSAERFLSLAQSCAAKDQTSLQQGDYLWSDDSSMPEGVSDELDKLAVGQYSEPTTIDADDATEIVYCVEDYTFPNSEKIQNLELTKLTESLVEHMRDKASDSLYSTDCSNYLDWLLSSAQVTYYPIPADAAYNVSANNLASSSSSSDASGDDSSTDGSGSDSGQ